MSPYGFESSAFAVESETMQLIDPCLMSTRTQVTGTAQALPLASELSLVLSLLMPACRPRMERR